MKSFEKARLFEVLKKVSKVCAVCLVAAGIIAGAVVAGTSALSTGIVLMCMGGFGACVALSLAKVFALYEHTNRGLSNIEMQQDAFEMRQLYTEHEFKKEYEQKLEPKFKNQSLYYTQEYDQSNLTTAQNSNLYYNQDNNKSL